MTPGSRGTWGVVVGNMSVVVQRARREDAGEYTCTAHNPEGSTRSVPVRLEINRECRGVGGRVLEQDYAGNVKYIHI